MALMKECAAQACWVLDITVKLCFVVFTLTSQTTKALDCVVLPTNSTTSTNSTSHMSPTSYYAENCPNVKDCNIGFFWTLSMTAWVRVAICGFTVAGLGFALVRSILDGVKPSQVEEWNYKRAFDAFYDAGFDFDEAALALEISESRSDAAEITEEQKLAREQAREEHRRCSELKELADEKMKSVKPLSGISLVERRFLICCLYCASVVCLVASALCANISFFVSMEEQIGCVKKSNPWLIPHYAVTVFVLVWGGRFFFVGIRSMKQHL